MSKIKDNSSDSSQNQSSEDYTLNEIRNLKSLEEIKEEAKFKTPQEYKAIYDIDPQNNYILVKDKLESNANENEKINFFYENMYLLNTKDRESLFKEYNNIFKNSEKQKLYPNVTFVQTKSIKEIFYNVLKIMKFSDDYKILKDSLEQENFINSVPNCFIPINEGDENLVFCYLTYNIYTAFFIKKSKPQNTNNLYKLF